MSFPRRAENRALVGPGLSETKSHLPRAVRPRPIRRESQGHNGNLRRTSPPRILLPLGDATRALIVDPAPLPFPDDAACQTLPVDVSPDVTTLFPFRSVVKAMNRPWGIAEKARDDPGSEADVAWCGPPSDRTMITRILAVERIGAGLADVPEALDNTEFHKPRSSDQSASGIEAIRCRT
jgi:hypothetical protein